MLPNVVSLGFELKGDNSAAAEDLLVRDLAKLPQVTAVQLVLRDFDLVASLMDNQKLTDLDLSHSLLELPGGEQVAASLRGNVSLLRLSLGSCGLRDEAGIAIAKFLSDPLQELNLNGNYLTSRTVAALLESLRGGCCLTSLDLSGNCIGQQGVRMFAEFLQSDSQLFALDLRSNDFSTDLNPWLAALENNSTLAALNLDFHRAPDEDFHHLFDRLRDNDLCRRHIPLHVLAAGEQGFVCYRLSGQDRWAP